MKKVYIVGIMGCVAALGALFLVQRAGAGVPPLGQQHFDEWRDYIDAVGPAEAYQSFGQLVRHLQPSLQHEHAHYFGAALYRAEGTSGLSTCDSRFAFGCFHEFLGSAIKDLGLDVVYELNDGCRVNMPENPLSCQHGIGHGVLAHLGYDDEALFESLRVCRDLPDADVIGGCYGGAFMEYNLRTMLGVGAEIREASDPQYPCSIVDGQYLVACLFWQPQWWLAQLRTSMLGEPLEEMIRVAGGYCVESRDRAHCFEGIGNIMLAESRVEHGAPDEERARALCATAARTPSDELRCLSITANHFGIEQGIESGRRICSDLVGESRTFCEAHATNVANIAKRPRFPI